MEGGRGGGYCPEGNYLGVIARGNYSGTIFWREKVRAVIVLGQFHRGQLPGGQLSNCPGAKIWRGKGGELWVIIFPGAVVQGEYVRIPKISTSKINCLSKMKKTKWHILPRLQNICVVVVLQMTK